MVWRDKDGGIDWKLAFSAFNSLVLVLGFIGGLTIYFVETRSKTESNSATVKANVAEISALHQTDRILLDSLTRTQQETSNRLTKLETQNVFVLAGLDEIKQEMRSRK